ncbi:hypothetical protein DYD83_08830 [Dickeya fangzhongdai]|uniref:Uncharacterized protein n=2 Tax=Dickeya TaxID=204037 RepID=A0A3N0FWG2_9GAMM|nr:hypothetical protein CVE23_08785 [Dickeya fangzhongdai]RNM04238.1 hypothetical protein EF878_16530 [Dickeya undicola]AYH47688.1 hypothetical protein B6N31_08320 [Dickeya fangzhongdai]QOH47485.1 hypothetical protein DYD82_08830 [Dickeya fangzhongdai]QOH51791.1 hypothetical protein DYD83_08830 [Dickeya fangzhongdai]
MRRCFSLRRVFQSRGDVCPDNIINLLIQLIILICLGLVKVCSPADAASIKPVSQSLALE